jgi:hypothetical protein
MRARIVIAFVCVFVGNALATVTFTGVNLAGAEFGISS